MDNLKAIVECLLFAADSPLTMDHFKKAMPDVDPGAIRQAVIDLADEYAARNGGIMLNEVAGGYQLRTRPEYAQWVRQLFQPTPPRLSQAAMETLAIIAYRQPVLRSEIEQIRGVNSGNTLKILLERRLIRVLGRREIPGRPLVYATTRKFLETFDLKDLKDLPEPGEIEIPASGSSGIGIDALAENNTPADHALNVPEERPGEVALPDDAGTDIHPGDPFDTRQLSKTSGDIAATEDNGPKP